MNEQAHFGQSRKSDIRPVFLHLLVVLIWKFSATTSRDGSIVTICNGVTGSVCLNGETREKNKLLHSRLLLRHIFADAPAYVKVNPS